MTDTTAGEGPFGPLYYEHLRQHAMTALREGKPFQINADGAIALIGQARADREALAAQPSAGAQVWIKPSERTQEKGHLWLVADDKGRILPGVFVNHRIPENAALVQRIVLPREATPAQPDTGDVAALREALEPFAEMADKFAGSMVEVCHPHPDNPSPTIQPLPVAYLERAKQTLAALSKPNAPGAHENGGAG